MAEEEATASEPRYWKITVNPEECPKGAWAVSMGAGLALLGLPGEAGEANYAVRNLKRLEVGDWLVAYTPQEGSYTVGGVGRVARGYRCEEGPFDHPWNGPVRRSVAVDWQAGACVIDDLVKGGRFRKGKIPRVLDEILPEEFACISERVLAVAAADAINIQSLSPGDQPSKGERVGEGACSSVVIEVGSAPVAPDITMPDFNLMTGAGESFVLSAVPDLVPQPATEILLPPANGEISLSDGDLFSSPPACLRDGWAPAADPKPILDPTVEPPPLPQFFLDWALAEPMPVISDGLSHCASAPRGAESTTVAGEARPRRLKPAARPIGAAAPLTLPGSLEEAAVSLRRSRAAHLLSSFPPAAAEGEMLDFGLPSGGDPEGTAASFDMEAEDELLPFDDGLEPFEVRVGALGWTGIFRREMESGRPCSLLLRGPRYSFLKMAAPGAALRGLPLFALFASGAVAAPGKEALRSGATFIFRGRRIGGDYAVEVRPRQRRPLFRAPVEASP